MATPFEKVTNHTAVWVPKSPDCRFFVAVSPWNKTAVAKKLKCETQSFRNAKAGKESVIFDSDYRGDPVISVSGIVSGDRILMAEMDLSESFGGSVPSHADEWLVALFCLATGIIVGLVHRRLEQLNVENETMANAATRVVALNKSLMAENQQLKDALDV